jgi:hypothetical protein
MRRVPGQRVREQMGRTDGRAGARMRKGYDHESIDETGV